MYIDELSISGGNIELVSGSIEFNTYVKFNDGTSLDATIINSGQILYIGSTGANPVFSTLTYGDGISGVAGAGTLQIGINPTYSINNFAGTLNVSKGGTGLSSTPTAGQLLIGNGTGYTLSTLTAGSGVTITNGAGSITLAVDFTTSVVGGSGIAQTGNQLDIVSTNGGIVVGANDITLTTDGSTLTITSNGIKIANNGVTETQLNTSVAGAGLTGGGGSPLDVQATSGVIVSGDYVQANVDNATIKISSNQIALKKYTVDINVADWNDTGEYAYYTVSGGVHLYGTYATVKTYAAYSGDVPLTTHTGADNYIEYMPDQIKFDTAGNDIILRVVCDNFTDARYAARIIIG